MVSEVLRVDGGRRYGRDFTGQQCAMKGVGMSQSYLVRPEDGELVLDGPVGAVVMVPGRRTGGLLSIVEHPVAPGGLVPPHVHEDVDEWSYVLTGEIGARIGDEELTAPAGSYVLKPRGIPHTFWNAGPAPARILEMITPAGFERFFAALGQALRSGAGPAEAARLAADYRTTNFDDWTADLQTRHGVRLG